MSILNRTTGIILIVLGILIIAVDFMAAPLGLGGAIFGPKKILALVVGVLIVFGGFAIAFWRSQKKS